MSKRRRRALFPGLLFGLLVGALIIAALRPHWVLEAEFSRQRWLAGASVVEREIDGQRWTYLEAGEGPLLILVHGFTGAKENWLPVMGRLSSRFRVIAPDLPGWGQSARADNEDLGFSGQAKQLDKLVLALADEQPVYLAGHSMGGGIAAVWAGTAPSRLDRLILLDAAGIPFENDFARRVRAGEHPFEVRDEVQLRNQLNMVFKTPPWIPWPASKALAEQRSAQVDFEREVLAAIAGDEQRAFAPSEAARSIQVPTLLLWCRDDQIIDASSAQAYADRIAQSAVVMLDECNHMPMMEQPEETAQVMLEFLSVPVVAVRRVTESDETQATSGD